MLVKALVNAQLRSRHRTAPARRIAKTYLCTSLYSLMNQLLTLSKVMSHGCGRAYLPNGLGEVSSAKDPGGTGSDKEAYCEHHVLLMCL